MRARLQRLIEDESGATMVEYTVLLGILLVCALTSIVFVAGWVTGQWSTFFGLLP